jgi:hypothetical protein
MDQCVKCADHQYTNQDQNHCHQKSVTFLGYEDLLGMALASKAVNSVLIRDALVTFCETRRHYHCEGQ